MGYSVLHETSNLCSGTLGKGARGFGSRAALQRRLRSAPMPDPSGELSWALSSEDSQEFGMRLADGKERHPRLQRAWARRPNPRLLAPQARVRRFRPRERRSSQGDAPPPSERVRVREQPVDARDGRTGRLRGGTHPGARLGGDHPGYFVASSGGEMDASPRRWITSPDPLYERKKGGATG